MNKNGAFFNALVSVGIFVFFGITQAKTELYLIDVHGISELRLIEKGYGERRLLNASLPEDGVNFYCKELETQNSL